MKNVHEMKEENPQNSPYKLGVLVVQLLLKFYHFLFLLYLFALVLLFLLLNDLAFVDIQLVADHTRLL